MTWFCGDEEMEGFGVGQIMLALSIQTQVPEEEAAALLERRAAGEGWGQIKQDLGLIGRGAHQDDGSVGDPEDEGETLAPAQQRGNNGNPPPHSNAGGNGRGRGQDSPSSSNGNGHDNSSDDNDGGNGNGNGNGRGNRP